MAGFVRQNSAGGGLAEQTQAPGISSRLGLEAIMDFYTYAAVAGWAYQVKQGTITTPVVGQVPITDAAANLAVACPASTTIIPVSCNVTYRLAAGTLFETAGKSAASSTMSGGTAFIPLPLRTLGPSNAASAAATSTAMVAAAGGVTVTAELATTTRRHFAWSQPIAAGAWPTWYDWNPRVPPILAGPSSFYIQIGGAGTAPSAYCHFDFLEILTAALI